MRFSLITVCLLVALAIAFVDARPKKQKPKPRQDPAKKIFEFLDKKKEGKVAVDDAKPEIQKMLPLSDDKNIDANNDGFVTLPEFRKFYRTQYREWKANHLKKN